MSVADVPHAMSRKEGRQHRGFLSRASIWVSFLLDRFEVWRAVTCCPGAEALFCSSQDRAGVSNARARSDAR